MTYDRVLNLIDRLGVPVAILVFLGYLFYRFIEGPGNELIHALIAYVKEGTEQLGLLPGIVREEGTRSRDETLRAHVETRALLSVLLQGVTFQGNPRASQPSVREEDTPTPTEPAIRRSNDRVPTTSDTPAPRRPMPSTSDAASPEGERSSGAGVRPPLPSQS